MILYPAVDLRGGMAVQLVGGKMEAQRIALPDPVAVAMSWVEAGFRALHLIDLDAALGNGNNRDVIAEILTAVDVPVQVGGGVRDDAAVDALLEAGAARVIVGTRAIEDSAWRVALTRRYDGDKIVVAADIRGENVTVRGWTHDTHLRVDAFIAELNHENLAGVLITDVGREGALGGVDVGKFERLAKASRHPVLAAGGIRDLIDVRALAGVGVAGAVLGMSIYVGTIDAQAAVAEFV